MDTVKASIGSLPSRDLNNTHKALRRCWHPVARCCDISESPTGVLLLGENLVVFRSGDRARVFYDRCPHRGYPMHKASVEAGGLRCAYHGWLYASSGECTQIPALAGDTAIPSRARLRQVGGVEERFGLVFVCLDEPLPGVTLPELPEASDTTFMAGDLPVLRARSCAGLLADNFLDTAHFPFVHAGTFGAGEERVVGSFDVRRSPVGTSPGDASAVDNSAGDFAFSAYYEHTFANREDPAVARGERPLNQTRRLLYRYVAPFHLSLRIDYVEAGGTNTIGFFVCPETDEYCRIFSTIWRNDLAGDEERMRQAVAFELEVLKEDLLVQESMATLVLPLATASNPPGTTYRPAEIHTRADRTTVELRRVLADLVARSAD